MMKIGLVCPYDIYAGGGVQEYVIALRDEFENLGCEAKIITPQPRRSKNRTAQPPKDTIMIGGAAPFRGLETTVQVSASMYTDKLNDMLRREDFDILHFHEPWIPILSRQILSRSDTINIGTFHASMPEKSRLTKTFERVVNPYTKSILKYLDVFTAVSEPASVYLRSLSPSRQIHIIPNGINLKKYNNDSPDHKNSTKTIFYIGRLEKRKGVRYLIEAFNLLTQKDSDFQLIIAGEGPEKTKLKELVDFYGLKNVRFLGYVNEEYKKQLFRESDVFCSPALHGESFGIVLLEAMASGCAVVAGNNYGYESVMQGAGAISLVNPKDRVEFARRLHLMAKNEPLRKTWQKWAEHEVRQYSYEHVAGQYIKMFQAALKKKHT
jgi:phosphatidylinositol alpha-mannosyltransferase